ncbi:hypothetical protein BDN72DRAFT_858099 [Pluteus cervinus]|uniref:Uncharacterized protein n=1 Tax=Pluteus cervinus TaxID=181527 RepID=A0ACD3AT99_9AGAR|nr:hypothetical protein BDN72DRAFT_858099 [Pluteus cervinus]
MLSLTVDYQPTIGWVHDGRDKSEELNLVLRLIQSQPPADLPVCRAGCSKRGEGTTEHPGSTIQSRLDKHNVTFTPRSHSASLNSFPMLSTITITPTNSPNSRLDAQHKVDEEIFQLEARIISLKSARNALAPISRLPPEIFQEIFSFTHRSSPQHSKGKVSLLITWVSHAWRQLGHSTSDLWAHIDFHHPKWIEAALSRTSNYRDLHLVSSLLLCLNELSRTTSIVIGSENSRFSYSPTIKAVPEWTTPAHTLITLQLFNVDLPSNLFSGICPFLQSLYLSWCSVDWVTFPALPLLKTFSIMEPTVPVTTDQVIKIIRAAGKSLEALELDYGFTKSQPDNHSQELVDPVQLEKLRLLHIFDESSAAVKAILDQVLLPVHLDSQFLTFEWMDSLPEAFLSSRKMSGWDIDCLVIACTGAERVTATIIQDSSHGIPDGIKKSLRSIQQHNPQSTETRFTLCNGDISGKLAYFGRLGTVRELYLDGGFKESFKTAIQDQHNQLCGVFGAEGASGEILDQDQHLGQGILSFHNLQSLVIRGGDREPPLELEDILVFQKWLAWRNKLSLPLRYLTISQLCVPSRQSLHQAFDEVVQHFTLGDVWVMEHSDEWEDHGLEDPEDLDEWEDHGLEDSDDFEASHP